MRVVNRLCKLNVGSSLQIILKIFLYFLYALHSREVNPLNIDYKGKSRFVVTKEIAREIFRREGIRGYYRGYFTSLAMFAPNSALWWNFYQVYQGKGMLSFSYQLSQLLILFSIIHRYFGRCFACSNVLSPFPMYCWHVRRIYWGSHYESG